MEKETKFIELAAGDSDRKFKICYSDSKFGDKTVVFLHGFGSFSHTFEELQLNLPENCRFLKLNFSGNGSSDTETDFVPDIKTQAALLKNFINKLDLKDVILIGHSIGASAASLCCADENIAKRISRLVLLSPLAVLKNIPDFIKNIATYDDSNPLIRFASEDIFSYVYLTKAFFSESKIKLKVLKAIANSLSSDKAKEHLILSARAITKDNFRHLRNSIDNIHIPTLILWGAEDEIFDIEDGYFFRDRIKNSEFELIQHCGHLVHEEVPQETGRLISKFIDTQFMVSTAEKSKITDILTKKRHSVRLRDMVENWTLGTLTILLFMKFIQFLRFLGLRANENGWRKASGIFLQKEQSKFILGCFHLKYYREYQSIPFDLESAKTMFIHRMAEFLRQKSVLHWAIEPAFFDLKRKRTNFIDIIESQFAPDGTLVRITPYFDRNKDPYHDLSEKHIHELQDEFINYYNKLINKKVKNIPRRMSRHLKTWMFKVNKLGFTGRFDMLELINRMMTASFINFEVLPDDCSLRKHFATPKVKIYRHPGWGLLNMIVRFTHDFASADLWMQYHHVPVDGLPMQEILEELKKQWGATQPLIYPAMDSHDARPEMSYCGNSLFRGRIFADFTEMLAIRKRINEQYTEKMSGPATVAAMMMWGLCQHPFFRDAKILFPVDIAKGARFTNERELNLLFSKPDKYFDSDRPYNGLLDYCTEFNRMLATTRTCKNESYEMMELYSMVHPLFYHLARHLMPKATSEYLGTVGISIMRNAEMFLTPLSDLQRRGFMAVGNLQIPTADGRYAGAVSICGTRREIKAYFEAITDMTTNYEKYIKTKEDNK